MIVSQLDRAVVCVALLTGAGFATPALGVAGPSSGGQFQMAEQTNETRGVIAATAPDRRSAHAEGWVVGSNPANGSGVILHTKNGGYQWDRQGTTNEIPNVELNNVQAVNHQTVWVVGDNDSGYGLILRTDNGGRTWVRQGQPGLIPDVALFGVGGAGRKCA